MAYVKDLARPESIVDRQITGQSDSWKRMVAVTPSDSTVYSPRLQGLFIGGTGGTVAIENSNGDIVSLVVAANSYHFEEIRRVLATGTTGVADVIGLS